jgi:hypothetical protein
LPEGIGKLRIWRTLRLRAGKIYLFETGGAGESEKDEWIDTTSVLLLR